MNATSLSSRSSCRRVRRASGRTCSTSARRSSELTGFETHDARTAIAAVVPQPARAARTVRERSPPRDTSIVLGPDLLQRWRPHEMPHREDRIAASPARNANHRHDDRVGDVRRVRGAHALGERNVEPVLGLGPRRRGIERSSTATGRRSTSGGVTSPAAWPARPSAAGPCDSFQSRAAALTLPPETFIAWRISASCTRSIFDPCSGSARIISATCSVDVTLGFPPERVVARSLSVMLFSFSEASARRASIGTAARLFSESVMGDHLTRRKRGGKRSGDERGIHSRSFSAHRPQ
jgi:hypothetical protein